MLDYPDMGVFESTQGYDLSSPSQFYLV